MDIYLTQHANKKLCELFDIEYNEMDFEPFQHIGEPNPPSWNKGIPHTEEYKKRMREILLKVAPMKGINHSDKTKEKIRQKRKEQIFSKEAIQKRTQKLYKQLQTPDGLFTSRKEAAKYYDVDPSAINYWLKIKPTEYYYIKGD
jgi:hypothetical protein